jgi:hypothetical protein
MSAYRTFLNSGFDFGLFFGLFESAHSSSETNITHLTQKHPKSSPEMSICSTFVYSNCNSSTSPSECPSWKHRETLSGMFGAEYQLESFPSRAEDCKIWIHYVGSTGGGTPYEGNRSVTRKCEIFGAFMEDIIRIFQMSRILSRIPASGKLQGKPWGNGEIAQDSSLIVLRTNYERRSRRVLIALLKKSILPNRQTGGTYASLSQTRKTH